LTAFGFKQIQNLDFGIKSFLNIWQSSILSLTSGLLLSFFYYDRISLFILVMSVLYGLILAFLAFTFSTKKKPKTFRKGDAHLNHDIEVLQQINDSLNKEIK